MLRTRKFYDPELERKRERERREMLMKTLLLATASVSNRSLRARRKSAPTAS